MYALRTKGFTLIELMVTIAVLAILLAIAFPSFQGSMRSNRLATTTNEVLASVALARSEGLRSRGHGAICPSADGLTCGVDWNEGWIVWSDTDDSSAVDGDEFVVRYVQGHPRLAVSGSADSLAFDARGRAVGGAVTIGLKPDDKETPARCISITATGQTKVKKEACT